MASNYVLNQKISSALAKSAEALAVAQAGGGGGGGGIGSLSEVLDTAKTTAPTATDGDALHFPIKNAGEIESTNHQIIKHGLAVNSTPTALGDITFDSANGDNLLIQTIGTRNIQIGATSGTDVIGIGKVPNSVGSKIQVEGGINCAGSYIGEGFTLTDTAGSLHALATYDLPTTRIQLGTITDDFRIRAPSSALYDFTASEMTSTEKVRFDNAGLHTSTTFATRQNGDRVVLYSPASGTNDQYTLGIEGGAVRMSSGQSFKFYYRPPTYFTDLAVGESEAFRIEAALGGTNLSLRPFNTQGDLKVLDSTATTTSLHVDTTNSRVGINKANPTEDLDVDGNIQINTSGTGSLKFYDNTGAHDHAQVTGEDDGTNGGKLVLKTKTDGGAVAARVTIDGVGAIGIGPTPNYGTSGQVLTSQGPATTPIWATPSGGGGGGTTVYGGTWFPNAYTYFRNGSANYVTYYTPGDTVNNPWYSSTYGGDSHGRYSVTVFPGTPNRYKVDLWFLLYCGGSGSAANDIYRHGYSLSADPTFTTGSINTGATLPLTFSGGNITAGAKYKDFMLDVSNFNSKIATDVGTSLVFDPEYKNSDGIVNVSSCMTHETIKNNVGGDVARSVGIYNQSIRIYYNDFAEATGFDPTGTISGNIATNTSLGWGSNTGYPPLLVPTTLSPSDLFSLRELAQYPNATVGVHSGEFYVGGNATSGPLNRSALRSFSGSLSYWMVES